MVDEVRIDEPYPRRAAFRSSAHFLDACRRIGQALARLAPPLPLLDLPTDRPRPAALSAEGDWCEIALTEADIQPWLDRRRPGQGKFVTQRQEPDTVKILSGVFQDERMAAQVTTGGPPLFCTRVRIEAGEILVAGPTVAPGAGEMNALPEFTKGVVAKGYRLTVGREIPGQAPPAQGDSAVYGRFAYLLGQLDSIPEAIGWRGSWPAALACLPRW